MPLRHTLHRHDRALSAVRLGKPGGAPLVALHGFTGDGEDFGMLASQLDPQVDLLAPDLIGHGRSDAPEERSRYTIAACAEDVLGWSAALGELRGEPSLRPALLGYSMGGRVALTAAVARPEAWSALILIGATAGIDDEAERAARQAADARLAAQIRASGVEAFLAAWRQKPIIATQRRTPEPWRGQMAARRRRNRAAGLSRSLEAMGTGAMPPLWGRLGAIACPVLLVVGEEDVKFQRLAARLRGELGAAEVAVIDGAGHAAHLEAPERFGERLEAFLARLDLLN